jgi:hypothetical protein
MINVELNESENMVINSIEIDEIIFDNEISEYRYVEVENEIDILIDMISETEYYQRDIMKSDLKSLIDMSSEYVFTSISTNEFISIDSNPKRFEEICNDILVLQKEQSLSFVEKKEGN